jgi:hypothetical protein
MLAAVLDFNFGFGFDFDLVFEFAMRVLSFGAALSGAHLRSQAAAAKTPCFCRFYWASWRCN